MKLPVDIRFMGLAASAAVEGTVREKVAQVERLCPEITAWRVTIEQEGKHQHQGRPFAVRVDITLPGQEIAINRVQDEDVYVALRDAFDAARRKVDETMRIRRGEVKQHASAGGTGEAA